MQQKMTEIRKPVIRWQWLLPLLYFLVISFSGCLRGYQCWQPSDCNDSRLTCDQGFCKQKSEQPVIPTKPPKVPTGVQVEFVPTRKYNYVSWNKVKGATHYRLYWGTSSNVTKGSNPMPLTVTVDFAHSGVQSGITFYYRVAAVNEAGESKLSKTVSSKVP